MEKAKATAKGKRARSTLRLTEAQFGLFVRVGPRVVQVLASD